MRVIRTDPLSKDRKEWTIDLTRIEEQGAGSGFPVPPRSPVVGAQPQGPSGLIPSEHDLWLRDGDVIEIPEKR